MNSRALLSVDRFPAAEIVRIPLAKMPAGAAAYTDGHRIFVPVGVSAADERTIIRHESAHIWLRHFRRGLGRVNEAWKVACEMEIARNIYDAKDLRTLADRSSMLHGGYQPDSVPACPASLKLAEEIYDWLMQQVEQLVKSRCACGQCDSPDGPQATPGEAQGSAAGAPVDVAAVAAARESLDAAERQTELQHSVTVAVKQKTPATLASEMDALFRAAFSRDRSYRRPPRRELDGGLLERGRANHIRTPKVQIYVDRSGSFSAAKTAQSTQAVAKILTRYRARLRADTFWFGNQKLEQQDFGGGGNTPYDLVVKHINATSPEVAIVITDDDAADGCGNIETATKVLIIPIDCQETSFGRVLGATHLP